MRTALRRASIGKFFDKTIVTRRRAAGMMRLRFNLSIWEGKLMKKLQFLLRAFLLVCCSVALTAGQSAVDGTKTIKSFYAPSDFDLTADSQSNQWKNVKGVIAARGPMGDVTAG